MYCRLVALQRSMAVVPTSRAARFTGQVINTPSLLTCVISGTGEMIRMQRPMVISTLTTETRGGRSIKPG
jgi:hypothetical protein